MLTQQQRLQMLQVPTGRVDLCRRVWHIKRNALFEDLFTRLLEK